MTIGHMQGILELEGINAARAFLGYPPLPQEIIDEAERNSELVRHLKNHAIEQLNECFRAYGVTFI